MENFLTIFGIPIAVLFLVYIVFVAYKLINKALDQAEQEATIEDEIEVPEYITIKKSELKKLLEENLYYESIIEKALVHTKKSNMELDSIINVERYVSQERVKSTLFLPRQEDVDYNIERKSSITIKN